MVLAKLPARLQSMSLEDLQTAPPSTSMEMSRGNVRSLLTEKIQAQVSLAQLSAPLGYDYAVAEGLAAWQAAWISQSPAAAYAVPPLTFALHWLVVTGLGSPATSVDLQQVLGKGCTVALGDDAQRAKVGVTAAPAAQAAVEPVEAVWLAWNAGEHPVASVQQVVQKWLGNTSAVIVLHTHPSLSNEAVAQQLDLGEFREGRTGMWFCKICI